MSLYEVVPLALIGLFAGLVGGMLGVGGSIVMIPAMTEVLGPDQHLYQAAAMIVNFFVVVPAVYQHHRAGAVDFSLVARIVPLAVAGVLAGVAISELPLFAGGNEALLRGLFGLFLFFVAASELYRALGRTAALTGSIRESAEGPARSASLDGRGRWRFAAAVALPTGLVAGILGVGGGIVAVPLQRRILRVPIRTAIANSATIIVATSLIGATAKNWAFLAEHEHNLKPLMLAAVLIPTAVLGSLVGSRLTHRAPVRLIRAAFFLLLLVAAIRLTYGALHDVSHPAAAYAAGNPGSAQAASSSVMKH